MQSFWKVFEGCTAAKKVEKHFSRDCGCVLICQSWDHLRLGQLGGKKTKVADITSTLSRTFVYAIVYICSWKWLPVRRLCLTYAFYLFKTKWTSFSPFRVWFLGLRQTRGQTRYFKGTFNFVRGNLSSILFLRIRPMLIFLENRFQSPNSWVQSTVNLLLRTFNRPINGTEVRFILSFAHYLVSKAFFVCATSNRHFIGNRAKHGN